MKAAIPVIVILVIAAAIATAITVFAPEGEPPPPPREPAGGENPLQPAERVTDLYIPEFEGIDQNGNPVSHEMFDGQVTIVDFIFTNCPAVCPMMTTRLEEATIRLRGTPVRFVSISMDPERDTPEVLREYAARYDADLTRWTFVTGEEDVLRGIASKGLKFGIEEDPLTKIPLADGTTMPNILHGTWFALVGPDRRVLELFQSSSPFELNRLVEWAQRAAEANGG